MTEIDEWKYLFEEERKAFDKLFKKHTKLLKEQGKLEKENEMLKEQLDEMIQIFEDSGLDYFISDELEEILE